MSANDCLRSAVAWAGVRTLAREVDNEPGHVGQRQWSFLFEEMNTNAFTGWANVHLQFPVLQEGEAAWVPYGGFGVLTSRPTEHNSASVLAPPAPARARVRVANHGQSDFQILGQFRAFHWLFFGL